MIKENVQMKEIIFENKEIIVFNKPAGMLVQSDRSFDVDMVSLLKSYLVSKKEPADVSVINRLDRPVSGIVLVAKNRQSAAKCSKELTLGNINKEYFAVVHGKLDKEKGVFRDYLLKDGKTNVSKVVNSSVKGAKEAVLEYETVAVKEIDVNNRLETVSLVKIHLVTGRHHQIRVQFASRNHALMGDTKYNPLGLKVPGWQNIGLCSYKMEVLNNTFSIIPSGQWFEYFGEELATLCS